ncbi:MAG: galactose mutarotase [Termitinemataceae bacterium]|nr:MAG: galactose mutarotase [Termitinemataceae bacterium]
MEIQKKLFGVLDDGRKIHKFELSAGNIKLCVSEFGASWTDLFVPDKNGSKDNILLGFSTLSEYAASGGPFFGGTMGRFANRIGRSSFVIDGETYRLSANEGENCLHGGYRGFDKKAWIGSEYCGKDGVFVRLLYSSCDGEEGFPGIAHVAVTYGVHESNKISADYEVRVSKRCPINITNHSYFNLNGISSNGSDKNVSSILDHKLKLNAHFYLPLNEQQLPTGEIKNVHFSKFDFLKLRNIAEEYDNCFVIDGEKGALKECAYAYCVSSGRFMRVYTTQEGMQVYTGNNLKKPHTGFCIETQNFPDAPNHPDFPSSIYGDGKEYSEHSVFEFGVI